MKRKDQLGAPSALGFRAGGRRASRRPRRRRREPALRTGSGPRRGARPAGGQAGQRGQRQLASRHRGAAVVQRRHHYLGEPAHLQCRRRQHQHPPEAGTCRSTSVARTPPLLSTARASALRTPGGTSIGISTRPCRLATISGQLAVAHPHGHRGAGAGVEREQRGAFQHDSRRTVQPRDAGAELDHDEGDLRDPLGRRVVADVNVPARPAPAPRSCRPSPAPAAEQSARHRARRAR